MCSPYLDSYIKLIVRLSIKIPFKRFVRRFSNFKLQIIYVTYSPLSSFLLTRVVDYVYTMPFIDLWLVFWLVSGLCFFVSDEIMLIESFELTSSSFLIQLFLPSLRHFHGFFISNRTSLSVSRLSPWTFCCLSKTLNLFFTVTH